MVELAAGAGMASSLMEHLNSRPRICVFMRRLIIRTTLALLQFFPKQRRLSDAIVPCERGRR